MGNDTFAGIGERMSRRALVLIVAFIGLVTAVRVAATHRVFAQVIDEPAHVVAGYEWLSSGDYRRVDIEHPPLARVIAAFPLWMSGAEARAAGTWNERGNALLLTGGRYEHNLALARIGNLIFVAMAIAVVAAWGTAAGARLTGIIATILYVSLPPILGHAGLATTDMAAAATIPLALFALARWLDHRAWADAVLLGIAIGAGLLSKFSFLIFFPAGALVIVAFHLLRARDVTPSSERTRKSLLPLAAAILLSVLIVWAGYRFAFGTIASTNLRAQEFAGWIFRGHVRESAVAFIEKVPVPAPLFFNGLLQVKLHDLKGHPAFLFGETSKAGWWYYFPVALLVKTPLPVLALAITGAFARTRTQRRGGAEPALIAAAILVSAMTASINIGVRHILPMYVPLAVAAAMGAAWLWERGAVTKAAATALIAWTVIGSAIAHPDYIAWFNALGGRHPERILADSNLDWGQDVLRLRRVSRDEHIDRLTGVIFTSADHAALGLPPIADILPDVAADGWVAVSETPFQLAGGEEKFVWLKGRTYRRIGKTIRLYGARASRPQPAGVSPGG